MKNRIFLNMYSRVTKYNKQKFWAKIGLLVAVVGLGGFLSVNFLNRGSLLTVSEIREEESRIEIKPISIDLPVKTTKVSAEEKVEPTTDEIESKPQEVEVPVTEEVVESVVTSTVQEVPTTQAVTYAPASTVYPAVLSNGNSAGAIGSEAAAQMAAATGVSQATWEYIIARESNGDPNAANASGASGLFQTMPGWGSTATVEDQINAAINAYNNQGLAAWGM